MQVTPSSYRLQAIGFIVLGVVGTVVSVLLAVMDDRTFSLLPLVAVGHGVYCAVQARRGVTRTVLRVDSSGLRTGDGVHDYTWAGVIMVWVGSSTGLRLPVVSQPVLHVFTQAGVEFARRAGTLPQARYTLPVGGLWEVSNLCDRLSKITNALIVDGTQVSRRTAAKALSRVGLT